MHAFAHHFGHKLVSKKRIKAHLPQKWRRARPDGETSWCFWCKPHWETRGTWGPSNLDTEETEETEKEVGRGQQ